MPDLAPAAFERPAVLRLGEWVVYPRLCRASRAGTPIHLRSQVIDLLVVLARRPGEIVSKEEVSAALWPGVHVSGSALSRCMAELRQVFDDDARSPWLIETISKRGYRLIAPVQVEDQESASVREALLLQSADVPNDGAEQGTNTASAVAQAASDVSDPARPRTRRRLVWLAATAGALVVAAGAWAVATWTKPGPALTGRQRVVLADVANTTGDKSFDGAIRLALAVQLEQAPSIRIVPDDRVRETLTLMEKPAGEPVVGSVALEVCRREEAALVLAGSIARLGKRFAVGVEAAECRQGETVARVIEEADDADGVLAAVGRVASAVRSRLGESNASLRERDVPVARATTASLQALKALSLGDARRDAGNLAEAAGYYRQATAIDPQFAVAWARLGSMLTAVGSFSEASDAFTRAFRAADRTSLPEKYYITAHYHLTVTGKLDEASTALQTWKRLYPGSQVPSVLLAAIYNNDLGRYQDTLDELARIEPTLSSATAAWQRTIALGALGRVDEALRALEDARFKGDLEPLASFERAALLWMKGDRAGLQAEADRAASAGGNLAFAVDRRRAEIAICEGRVHEARRLYAEAKTLAEKLGDRREAARSWIELALGEAVVGRAADARRALADGLAMQKDRDLWLRAAMVHAVLGDRDEARRALAEAAAAPAFRARTDGGWTATVTALVDGIDRPSEALLDLEPIHPYERGVAYYLAPLAVRAVLLGRADRSKDAIEACQEFTRWRGVNPTSPFLPLVRLTHARALAKAGDIAGSRAAYEESLAAWKEADPDLPLLGTIRQEYGALRR